MYRTLAYPLKRLLDILLSLYALLVLSPLMLLTALLIVLEDGRPIFYRQKRVGKDAEEVFISKFRSMKVNDVPVMTLGQVTGDHPMVTRVGRFIRRFKIDELPQLFDVLRGKLSLVGPRPTIIEQVSKYDDFQRQRLKVRPGVTGWAQMNGSVNLPWAERIALDVWYVDHWSLWLDLNILLRTVGVVLFGERPNPKALKQALYHEQHMYQRG